jgi:predicted nucleic acid-binding protein
MESVYIETTILSYLVANPARDIVIAGHQQTTQQWWSTRRTAFDCFISQVVIDEISAGDPMEVRKRLAVAGTMNALAVTVDAERITESIMKSGILPPKAVRDAVHIAVATVHNVQYLLTWNCKHLANAQIAKRIAGLCTVAGYEMPAICTPEELLEDLTDEK